MFLKSRVRVWLCIRCVHVHNHTSSPSLLLPSQVNFFPLIPSHNSLPPHHILHDHEWDESTLSRALGAAPAPVIIQSTQQNKHLPCINTVTNEYKSLLYYRHTHIHVIQMKHNIYMYSRIYQHVDTNELDTWVPSLENWWSGLKIFHELTHSPCIHVHAGDCGFKSRSSAVQLFFFEIG